jgi:hypothetical protein
VTVVFPVWPTALEKLRVVNKMSNRGFRFILAGECMIKYNRLQLY